MDQAKARYSVRRLDTFFAGLVLLAGCSTPDRPDSGDLAPIVVGPEDIHIVGSSDSIASVSDVMPLADGSAWILNNTEPYLIHLSSEGEVLRTLGRQGGGPGEFSWPSTLIRSPATGAVWVYDSTHGQFVRVEESARDPEVRPLPRDVEGIPRMSSYEYLWMSNGGRVWIRGTQDQGGFIFAQASAAVPWIFSLWSTDVVRLEGDGTLETVLSTSAVVGDPSVRFPGATRFLPYPMWAACPGGSLAVYDPNANLVRRFTSEGDSITTHGLPPERQVEITLDRIVDTVYPGVTRNPAWGARPDREELHQLLRRYWEQRGHEFSEVFPEYAHLDCSEDDTLWIQPFDTTAGEMGRGPSWLRITADDARGTAEFPPSFRPLRFHEGRIWGIDRDEFDVEHVAWLELP